MPKRWQCSVCGYVHVGERPPVSCPVCGADRAKFVLLEEGNPEKGLSLLSTFKVHPVAAHFPGGLLPTAAFLWLLSFLFGNPAFEAAALWLVMIATAVVPVSICSGFYDWQKHHAGRKAAIFYKKISLSITLLILGVVATALRFASPTVAVDGGGRYWLYLIAVLGMLCCVIMLGHYGSILVTQGFEKTPDISKQPTLLTNEDGWYKSLVAQAPEEILAADQGGLIRIWNHGAERIFGTPADKAIGQSLDLIIPENLRQRHWEGWGKVMRIGESRYGTNELLRVPAIRADGSRFSAEFSIVMLKDGTGTISGVAAILRDVTEQWEREKTLKSQLEICRNNAKDA